MSHVPAEPQQREAQGSGSTPCAYCGTRIQPGERCLSDGTELWCCRECWENSHTYVFVEYCQSRIYKRIRANSLEEARQLYEADHTIEADAEPVDLNYLIRIEDRGERVLWEPPVRCPQCGGTNIAYSEYVNRMFRTHHVDDAGVVVFDTPSDVTNWEDSQNPTLWCTDCHIDFPIPPDLEYTFE